MPERSSRAPELRRNVLPTLAASVRHYNPAVSLRALLARSYPVDIYAKRVTHNGACENEAGELVLYWMHAARRLSHNIALNFASEKAREAGLPLVVYEAPYPSEEARIQAFVAEGMRNNAAEARRRDIRYVTTLPEIARARAIVTDEFPTRAAQPVAGVATFTVDGNGIFPMRTFEKEQYSAKQLRDRARRMFEQYWTPLGDPISERVRAIAGRGSGISPYLHFGHIGIHEVVSHVVESNLDDDTADAFLEQAIIRRELSFNLCFYRDDYRTLNALPSWAKQTLDKHRNDRRSPSYTRDELERAETHDDVWNLAQRQLLVSGTMHNYLRMLWGKKIIEWSESPEEAQQTMIHFFDKYSLDGRDPNTYAGILWCFGKHDRPWYSDRPIFGTVRYMSSESTRKKVDLDDVERSITRSEASARILAAF